MKSLVAIFLIVLAFAFDAKATIQVRSEGASRSDVKQIKRALKTVEITAKSIFGDRYAELERRIQCEVHVYGAEREKANMSTATLESSGRDGKLHGIIHILGPSKYKDDLVSMGGQSKSSDEYTLRLLGHEVLSLYLEALSNTRTTGWSYYSAPSWFTQGSQEYVASLCLKKQPREEIFKNYLQGASIQINSEIKVSNPYSGGLVIMQFIADEFGKDKLLGIIASEAATFDEAFQDVLGARSNFQAAFQKWQTQTKDR